MQNVIYRREMMYYYGYPLIALFKSFAKGLPRLRSFVNYLLKGDKISRFRYRLSDRK